MPVYNGERFVREALDSLLAQTFVDFELIIADNSSTDGTETICRDYAARDARIRYVRQSVNRGAWANFRFVLDEAVGKYFMWAAADDVWIATFLDRAVRHLDSEPRLALAFSTLETRGCPGGDYIAEAIARLDARPLYQRVARYILQYDSRGKANLCYGLMRRGILRDGKLFFSLPIFGSDMLFVYAMLLRGPFGITREPLFVKRYNASSPFTTHFRYLADNFRYTLRYVRITSVARGNPLLILFVAALCGIKYVRDLGVWIGWTVKAVAARLQRLFVSAVR